MKNIKNDRLLRALRKQPTDCTPIWIMRQAGRYLPEYRATRERAGDFLTLCKTPELACEVTLQPLQRFNLDAAIIFSDILTIPDAMGLGLQFAEGHGPFFANPICNINDIKALSVPDPEIDLKYVGDAIRLCKQELAGKVPLIGFSGSPWTLATYMIEGGASRDFYKIKRFLYQDPESLSLLLTTLAESVTVYLRAQIAAGADVVMIFDTWGGILTTAAYQKYSLSYMTQITAGLQATQSVSVPVILFTKGGNQWLELIAASGCNAIGIDWTIEINSARQRVGASVALQGNMDPAILFGSETTIQAEVARILESYGSHAGHVFNLGHGISQHTDPDHVRLLVDTVHAMSACNSKILSD